MSNLTIDFSGLRKAAARTNQSASPSDSQVVGGSMLEALTPEQLARMFPAGSKMNTMASTSSIVSGGVGGGSGRPPSITGGSGARVPRPAPGVPPANTSDRYEDFMREVKRPPGKVGNTTINPGKNGGIDPTEFREAMRNRIKGSGLVGFVPPDGEKYGIKKGTAEEWANYFAGLAKHESGLNVNTHGDRGQFGGHGSRGLFQLSPQDAITYGIQKTPFTYEQLRDPNLNAQVAIRIHEYWLLKRKKGIKDGAGRYWGPLSREGWTPGQGRDRDLPWNQWARDDIEREKREAEAAAKKPGDGIEVDASPTPTLPSGERLAMPEGIHPSFLDKWNELSRAEQERFIAGLGQLGGAEKFNEIWAKNQDKVAREIDAGTLTPGVKAPDPSERVIEKQAKEAAVRKKPIDKDIKEAINYALEKSEGIAGGKLEFHVVSGGQDERGKGPRIGSTRHDHGNAADGDVYVINSNGERRKLDSNNPKDREIIANVTKHIYEVVPGAGVGGFSPDTSYMGGSRIHIGGPPQKGGKATIPWSSSKEVREAALAGLQARQKNIESGVDPLAEWKKGKEEAVAAAKAKKESTQASAAGPAPASPSVSDSPAPGTPGAITTPTPNSGPRTNETRAPDASPTRSVPSAAPSPSPPPNVTAVPRSPASNAVPKQGQEVQSKSDTSPKAETGETGASGGGSTNQEIKPTGSLTTGMIQTSNDMFPSASAYRAYMQATKLKEDDNHFSVNNYNLRQA